MIDTAETRSETSVVVTRGPKKRHVAAVVAGITLETYDFLTYAYFAIYIGQTFFPSHDPNASLLASLAVFGAGFITRPIGAIWIGRIGDRIGRRHAMMLSFALMGGSITALALTPSYAQIGIAAPILVILCRLVQGFALGGEVGPSTSFLLEAAPLHRRGFYVSFQYVGQSAAAFMAGIIGVALSSVFDAEGLRDYGWRIAMLIGAAVVPLALVIRNSLPETLHESVAEQATEGQRAPWQIAAMAVILIAAGTTCSYVLKYMTTYAIGTLKMAPQLAFTGTVIGGLVGMTLNPVGGWLSDRYGRKPVMLWAWTLLFLAITPAFLWLSSTRSAIPLFTATLMLGGVGTIAASAVLASITEALPARVRSQGLSFVYAIAIAVFGGTAQFNVAWLTSETGSSLAPAWYMMVAVGLGLLAMLKLPETAPARVQARESR